MRFNDSTINTTTNINSLGYNTTTQLKTYFDTLTIKIKDADQMHTKAHAKRVNLRVIDSNHVGISLDGFCVLENIGPVF
jgi:glycine dehydrogenase